MMEPHEPEPAVVLRKFVEMMIKDIDKVAIVRVTTWDPSTQCVDCQPLVNAWHNDRDDNTTYFEEPPMVAVPVLGWRLGGFTIWTKPQPGDIGIVLCTDRDSSTWLAGDGSAVNPEEVYHTHDSNDAMYIPFRPSPDAHPMPGIDTDELFIGREDGSGEIRIKTDGTIIHGARGATTRGVARVDDETTVDGSTDSGMVAWMAAVDAALSSMTPANLAQTSTAYKAAVTSIGGVPTAITGKITTASSKVEVE